MSLQNVCLTVHFILFYLLFTKKVGSLSFEYSIEIFCLPLEHLESFPATHQRTFRIKRKEGRLEQQAWSVREGLILVPHILYIGH